MDKKLKILHIAPFNTSNVPMTLVNAERALGYDSRLVTLARDRRSYEEDICLELPFIDFWGTKALKRLVSHPDKLRVVNTAPAPAQIPIEWRANGFFEKQLVKIREQLWLPKIKRAIAEHDLGSFDVYQLDGGLEFTRDGQFVIERKASGKKIICCYTGSDLRTRGVIPAIDKISDLNVTVEFDHLRLHPHIHHVFFPFEADKFTPHKHINYSTLRIGHAPTSRAAKGSHVIIPILQKLADEYSIEIVLIENLPYRQAIELKQTCDIFVDQIGDLGYGINSLEALAMEIPACTCLTPEFKAKSPEHPFVEVDAMNLREKLVELIRDRNKRKHLGKSGRAWVRQHHDSKKVVQSIHALAGFS